MAIATMDQLVAGITGGFRSSFSKAGGPGSGAWASFWTLAGQPGAGATPPSGAGEAPTDATAGALGFTNPSGGAKSYLASVELACGSAGLFYLYDRLVHTSGLSEATSGAQTVNSAAITRPDANGAGTELFLEVYAGTTSATATASYTNQDGTSGRTSGAVVIGSFSRGAMYPVPLAAGDTGVRSVQSVTFSPTGTGGTFGITIARRLALIPAGGQSGTATSAGATDAFGLGLPSIDDHACLWLAGYSTSGPGPIAGQIVVAQG